MATIVGLVGSLRKRSYNRALLRAAVERAPQGVTIELAGIDGLPVYDGDLEEAEGIPDKATQLKERIAAADGLLIASPEYNNSMPGALKNAIDWLTRPPKDIRRVFGGKPVGLIGATPGRGGTRLAQAAWLPVFRTLGMQPYFGKTLYVDGAGGVFDEQLTLSDAGTDERLRAYLAGFAKLVVPSPSS